MVSMVKIGLQILKVNDSDCKSETAGILTNPLFDWCGT